MLMFLHFLHSYMLLYNYLHPNVHIMFCLLLVYMLFLHLLLYFLLLVHHTILQMYVPLLLVLEVLLMRYSIVHIVLLFPLIHLLDFLEDIDKHLILKKGNA